MKDGREFMDRLDPDPYLCRILIEGNISLLLEAHQCMCRKRTSRGSLYVDIACRVMSQEFVSIGQCGLFPGSRFPVAAHVILVPQVSHVKWHAHAGHACFINNDGRWRGSCFAEAAFETNLQVSNGLTLLLSLSLSLYALLSDRNGPLIRDEGSDRIAFAEEGVGYAGKVIGSFSFIEFMVYVHLICCCSRDEASRENWPVFDKIRLNFFRNMYVNNNMYLDEWFLICCSKGDYRMSFSEAKQIDCSFSFYI